MVIARVVVGGTCFLRAFYTGVQIICNYISDTDADGEVDEDK